MKNQLNLVEINVEDSLINIEFSGDENNIEKYKKKLSTLGYPEEDSNNAILIAKSYFSCAVGKINK